MDRLRNERALKRVGEERQAIRNVMAWAPDEKRMDAMKDSAQWWATLT